MFSSFTKQNSTKILSVNGEKFQGVCFRFLKYFLYFPLLLNKIWRKCVKFGHNRNFGRILRSFRPSPPWRGLPEGPRFLQACTPLFQGNTNEVPPDVVLFPASGGILSLFGFAGTVQSKKEAGGRNRRFSPTKSDPGMHLAVCGRKRRGIEPLPLPVWKVGFGLHLKRDGKRLAAAQDLERDNISREYISFGLFQLHNGADLSAI